MTERWTFSYEKDVGKNEFISSRNRTEEKIKKSKK